MFTVYSERDSKPWKHEASSHVSLLRKSQLTSSIQVKALGIIWSKFPQYSPSNTIQSVRHHFCTSLRDNPY